MLIWTISALTYFNSVDFSLCNIYFIFLDIVKSVPFTSAQFKKFVWIILRRNNDRAWLTIIWKVHNVHITTRFYPNVSCPFDQPFIWLAIEALHKKIKMMLTQCCWRYQSGYKLKLLFQANFPLWSISALFMRSSTAANSFNRLIIENSGCQMRSGLKWIDLKRSLNFGWSYSNKIFFLMIYEPYHKTYKTTLRSDQTVTYIAILIWCPS